LTDTVPLSFKLAVSCLKVKLKYKRIRICKDGDIMAGTLETPYSTRGLDI